ncbi:aspartate aminotransferase family protein [Limobrevibacterium gyesilva]|uniref:Aminotransferase class III-fold pyridoxal phosphate-dependent enzyme n=1 Tax=Limobrevibacterium gyesilva TaxID=2991712 RepID=A0AA41YLH4_9PROT|nr:aminotransferase class III-fold pyridoxal phosphate-dependent enzyme [Limobrevibacterium gyesilva]MCW3475644.1 aminotransferase class III-fold pyridoxal phosphate-dependent enzyme [Limobrevibacterium gyesilva]
MSTAMVLDDPRINSRIVTAYRQRTPGSADLARQAADLLPSGITHDARHVDPYGIYVARAQGPHKWDVDGNRYVDFFGGHGALILGHGHPTVAAAIAEAAAEGSQFGASHPREIGWARAIQRLIPSAERVRFTNSGTEATLMAVRLARAFTGRSTLLRFKGHFHGWHDHMTSGYSNHFDGSPTPGVLQGIADKTVLVSPGDIDAVAAVLKTNPDIAAIILEPTGSSFGQVPLKPEFLHGLRALTQAHGALLIFDEVVTGFRTSRGGAQVAFGIRPDLSSFAKIVAGGMPGAAVAGRKDILDLLDFAAAAAAGREKIGHPGTFNANPVSAAAGIAALTILAETDANDVASARAAELRAGLNEVLTQERVPWAVYGTTSGFHLFMNPQGRDITPATFDPHAASMDELKAQPAQLSARMRLAMLVNGVDLNPRLGGFTSAAHQASDIADTVAAFRESIRMLRAENELPA